MRPSIMQRRGGRPVSAIETKQRRQIKFPETGGEIDPPSGPKQRRQITFPETGGEIDPPSGPKQRRQINFPETGGEIDPPSGPKQRRQITFPETGGDIDPPSGPKQRRQIKFPETGGAIDPPSGPKQRRQITFPETGGEIDPPSGPKQRRQAVAPGTDIETDPESGPESGIDSGNDTEDELSSASPTITAFRRRRNVKPSYFKGLGRRINRRQAVGAPDTDSEDDVNSATDDDLSSPSPRRTTSRRRNVKSSGTAKSVSGIKRRQAVGAPATDTEADSATDGVDTATDGVDSATDNDGIDTATDNDVDSATDGESDAPPAARPAAFRRNASSAKVSRTISLGKREKLVNGGQTNRRQAPAVPEPESASEPESEDDGEGAAGSPPATPTETATPPGVENPADMGRIGTETPGNAAPTATAAETALPVAESSNLDASIGQAQAQEIGQGSEETAGMGRGGVVAMGVLIGLAVLATVAFIFYKCRRRGQPGQSRGSKFAFWRRGRGGDANDNGINEKQLYTSRRPSSMKSDGRIMDQAMAAAYAAENGYGAGGRPASQRSSESLWQQKQDAYARTLAAAPKGGKGSLYSKQLVTGFWKKSGGGADGNLAVPSKAHVPPQSVAGKTEMTSQSGATESTWNTWGVVQHHEKPKRKWSGKIRVGGKEYRR